MTRMKCGEWKCSWVGNITEVLTAPNPFEPGEELYACPKCKSLNLERACDIEGCKKQASGGTPTSDGGYRFHCHDHHPKTGPRIQAAGKRE